MKRAPSDAGMDHIPEAGNFVSPGHDKASFDNGVRHAATWLMQRGVAKWEAAAFLGMTEDTLQKVYEHHHPDFLQNAARAFS